MTVNELPVETFGKRNCCERKIESKCDLHNKFNWINETDMWRFLQEII